MSNKGFIGIGVVLLFAIALPTLGIIGDFGAVLQQLITDITALICSSFGIFCGVTPPPELCGNQVCDTGETHSSCPADCPAPIYCGDGVCNGDETHSSCPTDCPDPCIPYSTVWVIGDSISCATPTILGQQCPQQYGIWEGVLDPQLGSSSASHNYAVYGLACFQLLPAYTSKVPDGSDQTVIVFCGINDIALGKTPAELEATLTQYYNTAQTKGNKIIFVNIGSDSAQGGQTLCPSTLAVNAWLETFTAQHQIPLVDFYHAYYSGVDCYSNPSLTSDGLHPNSQGYTMLGNLIFQQGFGGKAFGSCN